MAMNLSKARSSLIVGSSTVTTSQKSRTVWSKSRTSLITRGTTSSQISLSTLDLQPLSSSFRSMGSLRYPLTTPRCQMPSTSIQASWQHSTRRKLKTSGEIFICRTWKGKSGLTTCQQRWNRWSTSLLWTGMEFSESTIGYSPISI